MPMDSADSCFYTPMFATSYNRRVKLSKLRMLNYLNYSETRLPRRLTQAWLLTKRMFRTGEIYLKNMCV